MSIRLIQDLTSEKNRILEIRNKLTEQISAIELILEGLRPTHGNPITGRELVEHLKENGAKPKGKSNSEILSKKIAPAYRRPQEFWKFWFEGAIEQLGKNATKKQLYEHALKTVAPPPTFSAFKGGYERYTRQK